MTRTASPASEIVSSTPSLRRRMASFVYEGVLLFGVVTMAGLFYGMVTQQRHALQGTLGLQAVVFGVLGAYFTWFWSHAGQTLAMKTWHIRMVDRAGRTVTPGRALARFLASWIWFMPWLAVARVLPWQGGGALAGVLSVGVALYALTSRLHPQRQFWHDELCSTRLIDTRHAPAKARQPSGPPAASLG